MGEVKVGDTVRATLGVNVLVGEVVFVSRPNGSPSTDPVSIVVGATNSEIDVWLSDGWQFEVIRALPTGVGAVVRRSDGVVFLRIFTDDDTSCRWIKSGNRWSLWDDEEVVEGGFEVMFEGVESDG